MHGKMLSITVHLSQLLHTATTLYCMERVTIIWRRKGQVTSLRVNRIVMNFRPKAQKKNCRENQSLLQSHVIIVDRIRFCKEVTHQRKVYAVSVADSNGLFMDSMNDNGSHCRSFELFTLFFLLNIWKNLDVTRILK